MKRCSKCGIEKDEGEFHKHKNRKSGFSSQCKQCVKQYQQNNADKIRKYSKKYRQDNADKIRQHYIENAYKLRQQSRQYYKDNAEKQRQYGRQYYKDNAEKRKQYIKHYRQEHPEYQKQRCQDNADNIRQYRKQYYVNRLKTDQAFKISINLRTRLWQAIKSKYKSGSAVRDLGCSIPYLIQHLESQFLPGMNWNNWGKGEGCWNIDHIVPLHKFDLTIRDELLEACHYTNLRPMWQTDNLSRTYQEITEYPLMKDLTPEQRVSLIQCYMDYMYYNQISDSTGINVVRVKTIIDEMLANGELQ